MPRYIEQLTENITPASGDWLWIVDVSAEATDQDRKLSVGKLALLATANVFAEIVTASKGIAFPATQVASANANTLDDYEEGVWTPLDNASVALTQNTTARYTKIGNLVTIKLDVTWTANTSTVMKGLPFVNSSGHAGGAFAYTTHTIVSSLLINYLSALGEIYNAKNTVINPAEKRFIGSFSYMT